MLKMYARVDRYVNLTPHDVNVVLDDGSILVYKPEPEPARVDVQLRPIEVGGDAPMFYESYGEVVGLPDLEYGTFLIVSGLVCSARPDRLDLVHPVGLVRNEEGIVIGCKGFAPNAPIYDN